MTVLFGSPWNAPIDEGAKFVAVPVGEVCLDCDKPIEQGDSGLIMPYMYLDENGSPASRQAAIHRDCHLRAILGSVEHLAGQCTCHDPAAGPPAGTYAEQAARLRAVLDNHQR